MQDSVDSLHSNPQTSQWRDSYDSQKHPKPKEYRSELQEAREGWGMTSKYNSQSTPKLDREYPEVQMQETNSVRDLGGRQFAKDAFSRKKKEVLGKDKTPKKKKKREKSRNKGDKGEHVKVYLRVRPPTTEFTFINKISKDKQVVEITKDFELKAFGFNKIISPKEKQLKAFAVTCSDVLKGILQGYNGCLIAYGQTGSGKTFTILGDQEKNEKGLLQLSLAYLLASQKQIWLEISAVQIYMEGIYDIFDNEESPTSMRSSNKSMKFSNRNPAHYQLGHLKKVNFNYISKDGMKLQNLLTYRIENIEDVEEVVMCINENRRTAKTNMNDKSSRSHAVFMVKVHNPDFSGYSTFYLVDLAGSERLKKSQIKDKITMDETISINASLMALSKCITALVKQEKSNRKKGKSVSPTKSSGSVITKVKDMSSTMNHLEKESTVTKTKHTKHIPFRDSKLTMLLQNCLLGKSMLSLIVTISPDDRDVDESFSTLRFGQCAAKMEVRPMKTFEIEEEKKKEQIQREQKEHTKRHRSGNHGSEKLTSQMEQLDRETNLNINYSLSKNIQSLDAKNGKNIFKVDSEQEEDQIVKTSVSRRKQLMEQLIVEDRSEDLDQPIFGEYTANAEDRKFQMYEEQLKRKGEGKGEERDKER
jgi:hypothetical protein